MAFWPFGHNLVCGDALSAALGRFLCKSRLRFLSLYTPTVVRRVVSRTATALSLFSRRRGSTGEVGAITGEASGHISAVTLRVSEATAALLLQKAFCSHV